MAGLSRPFFYRALSLVKEAVSDQLLAKGLESRLLKASFVVLQPQALLSDRLV